MNTPYKMKHLFISAVPHTSMFCPSKTVPSSLNLVPCFSLLSSCGKISVARVLRVWVLWEAAKSQAMSDAGCFSRLQDRLSSRPQSWNSPAGTGKDQGKADCTPAVPGGPQEQISAGDPCRSSLFPKNCIQWKRPTLEKFMKKYSLKKDPHWRSLWRTVFQTISLVGPCARTGQEHEEEGGAETKFYEQITIPISYTVMLIKGRR